MLLDASPIRAGQSPGNNNPAVLEYDATGLRSTMSATWAELDKAVLKNALPNHLPGKLMRCTLLVMTEYSPNNYFLHNCTAAEWEKHQADIDAECERKGIPYVSGRKYKFQVSENYNTLRW